MMNSREGNFVDFISVNLLKHFEIGGFPHSWKTNWHNDN